MKIFRHLTASLVTFSVILAAGAFVLVLGLTFVVSIFKDVEISAWNVVATQIARWYVLFLGVYVIHNVLPVAVAHGRTRREHLAASAGFSVVLSVVLAVVAQLGYGAEGVLYGWTGWSLEAGRQGSPRLLAYFLMFLVWFGVGAFLAAAFDRYGVGGVLALPFGLAFVMVAGLLVPGSGTVPFLPNLPESLGTWWQIALVCFGSWLIALGGTWSIAKDMPVRTKAA